MLRDPNYFNVNSDTIGRVTSRLLFAATLIGLISVMIAGYLYDLFGRKALLTIYFLGIAFGLFFLPRSAPNVPALVTIRATIQLFLSTIISHPLVIDYVKKESRGRAIALTALGVLVGELFGVAVLF